MNNVTSIRKAKYKNTVKAIVCAQLKLSSRTYILTQQKLAALIYVKVASLPVAHGVGRVVGALGYEAGFEGSMLK